MSRRRRSPESGCETPPRVSGRLPHGSYPPHGVDLEEQKSSARRVAPSAAWQTPKTCPTGSPPHRPQLIEERLRPLEWRQRADHLLNIRQLQPMLVKDRGRSSARRSPGCHASSAWPLNPVSANAIQISGTSTPSRSSGCGLLLHVSTA